MTRDRLENLTTEVRAGGGDWGEHPVRGGEGRKSRKPRERGGPSALERLLRRMLCGKKGSSPEGLEE